MHVAPKQWPADGSLPPLVEEYVEWVLNPDPAKQPANKKAWAEAKGVHFQTVYGWHRDERVIRAIEKRAWELNIHPERTQRIMDAMFRQAEAGDTKAATLYLAYIEKLNPKRVIIQDERVERLSDAEFAAELEKLT